MTKKALVINSVTLARHVTGDNHPSLPSSLTSPVSKYFDAELLEDEVDELLGPLNVLGCPSLLDETNFSWYHPTPEMFLHNFLQMINKDINRDLANLASYFADLLTGFSGSLSEAGVAHLAPSLIALGSLAAAKQTFGLPETNLPDLGCLGKVSDDCNQMILTSPSPKSLVQAQTKIPKIPNP